MIFRWKYSFWMKASTCVFAISSLLMPASVAGLKPFTIGWWGKCSTTVLLYQNNNLTNRIIIRWQCSYWMKTSTCVFAISSLPVPASVPGFKPSTKIWWGECSTTVILYQYNIPTNLVSSVEWSLNESTYTGWKPVHFFPFSLSQCQHQQLDSNPKPWDDEASVLPLCYFIKTVPQPTLYHP